MPKHSRDDDDAADVIAPPPLIHLGFLMLALGFSHLWPLTIVGGSIATVAWAGFGVALAAVRLS